MGVLSTLGVGVKSVETQKTTKSESTKQLKIDVEDRKHG